jgi:hypothetical protein
LREIKLIIVYNVLLMGISLQTKIRNLDFLLRTLKKIVPGEFLNPKQSYTSKFTGEALGERRFCNLRKVAEAVGVNPNDNPLVLNIFNAINEKLYELTVDLAKSIFPQKDEGPQAAAVASGS